MVDLYQSPSPPRGGSASGSPGPPGEQKAPKDQSRIRRRNRLITSCLECRRRKLKCDKQAPCTNCNKFSRNCLFIAPALDPVGQAKLAEVKEKMGMLERTLEQDVARRSTGKPGPTSGLFSGPPLPGQEEQLSDEEEAEDVKGLEPTSLATEDAYYEDDDDGNIVDLGISMGRLRITERIGGFVRPRFSEELAQALKDIPEIKDKRNPFTEQTADAWMAPGRDYVAPSSGFFFAPGVQKTSLMTYLPSQTLVDKLMDQYWKAVHVIARTVHRPSFERSYEKFWDDISAGIEPRISFQAVVFAALLSSVISMSDERVLEEFGVAKDGLVENFKQGAESSLARANFLRTTKLETLQAFVMYLIPLCRAEVSRAHSALTGTCIRLAECMGLHRDPTYYTSNPIEIHIRRLIWYQICFLDIRTCESTGPRPQIRREEHDTKFPLNVDDVDLENGVELTEDRKYFTDMTITRMRFECYEMHRFLWIERPKLDSKKTTLTALLSKIQKFCQAMEKTYLPMLNKTHPLHVLAMEIYGILSCRMYIMVLQKFISNDQRLMPERLRQITLSTAIMTLEHSMTIEQTPALADWAWYIGALHQYNTALLILSEYGAKRSADSALEARIWRCLDFVFELPAALPPREKTRMVLEELHGRTEAYQAMRRFRAPKTMDHAGPRVHGVEYLRREAEREREARSSSVQSGESNFSISSGSSTHQQQHQQSHQAVSAPPQLGRLPLTQVGYGHPYGLVTTPDTSGGIPSSTSEAHNFSGFSSGGPPGSNLVSTMQAPHQQFAQHHHGGSEGGAGSNVMGHLGSGGSPMDAMPDIDWNEWDQLFGSAEMSSSILIPPFTFPQLSPAELMLQWPAEGLQ